MRGPKNSYQKLIAVITGSNIESIKLFEKMGYIKCAHFKNVGEKSNQILDVVIYQKEL
jgi:L-amino acid N-acyltransferase YncA